MDAGVLVDKNSRSNNKFLIHYYPLTAEQSVQANTKKRQVALSETGRPLGPQVIGASLARRVNQYVELKDKRLTDFSKSK